MKITRLLLRVKKKITQARKSVVILITWKICSRKLIRKWRQKSVVSLKRACLIELFHPSFFFHPTEFLRGLKDGNSWMLLIFIFQMSVNLSCTASKNKPQINLDNCVLVSCLLWSSVKKNNYLVYLQLKFLHKPCMLLGGLPIPNCSFLSPLKLCNLLFQF